jgi:uncharacterized protein (DUF342 family)
MDKLDLDKVFELNISEDQLIATLLMHEVEDREIRLLDFQKFFLRENILIGIDISAIKSAIRHQLYEEEIIIARGNPPGKSTPGYLEYFVDDKIKNPVTHFEDGKADFKNIEIVKMIDTGTPLIRKHPMNLGYEGTTVFNTPIPAEPEDDVELPMGENNRISPIDDNLLVAGTDGFIQKTSDGKINIKPVLKVREDVDFSTGNINFKGSVVVPGDVKSGFNVEATKDITIFGSVENCHIKTKNNVIIKKGFIGKNEGFIEAKGDVRVNYVENQRIVVEGSVYSRKELINAKVEAGNSVFIEKGKIIGGSITAGSKVDAFEIGTREGTASEITVGANNFIIKKLIGVENDIKVLEARKQTVQDKIIELANKKVNAKLFTEEMEEELERLKKEKNYIPNQIDEKKEIISHMEGDLGKLLEAKITVRGTLFANVKLTVGDKSYITKEDYKNVVVHLEDDLIQFSPRRG